MINKFSWELLINCCITNATEQRKCQSERDKTEITLVSFKLKEVVVVEVQARSVIILKPSLLMVLSTCLTKDRTVPKVLSVTNCWWTTAWNHLKIQGSLEKLSLTLRSGQSFLWMPSKTSIKNSILSSGKEYIETSVVKASYTDTYKVTMQKKCDTITEKLVMPCAKEMVAKVSGQDQVTKLNIVSLSNNTIRMQVDDMADDILAQVIDEVNSSWVKFCMHFDESTNVRSCAVPLGFIRYIHLNMIKEEFLLYKNLTTTTKGEDVFNTVSTFLESNRLTSCLPSDSWPCICHNGCLPHLLWGFVKEGNTSIQVDHCTIRQYSLRCKTLPASLKAVFDDVLININFIKTKDFNSSILKELHKWGKLQIPSIPHRNTMAFTGKNELWTQVWNSAKPSSVSLLKRIQVWLPEFASPTQHGSFHCATSWMKSLKLNKGS